ncbi:TetR/AcrR family transcriptional regulator [Gluconobacter kondonii]|uniref:TetR/AcrR family transcriptional regulator n=1 Tax=Gluconobacter kondonii TaxID=941463 RepID=UPI001B8C714B|nr:TetR/AcrR family transcriptional regulator [Gluconobacter kondonii]MBS1081230.1 TetR/AcrR family transcriptional regulator [Gluconobacter kondonii]
MSRNPPNPSPNKQKRKPKGKGEERLSEIKATACELFNKLGYENVSTRMIAEHLGVSQPTIYHYYKSKDLIFLEIARESFDKYNEFMSYEDDLDLSPMLWIKKMSNFFVGYSIKHPAEYKMAFMTIKFYTSPYVSIEEKNKNEQKKISFFLKFVEKFNEGIEQGYIRKNLGSAGDITQAFFGLLHGGISLRALHPYNPWEDPDKIIETQIDIILHGIFNNYT